MRESDNLSKLHIEELDLVTHKLIIIHRNIVT